VKKKPKTPPVTFTRLCAVSADTAYVACVPDANDPIRAKFTILSQLHLANWSFRQFDFALQDMCLFGAESNDRRSLQMLSWDGDVTDLHTLTSAKITDCFSTEQKKELKLGSFSKIVQIGPSLYSCGQGGQNYRRMRDGTWAPLDISVFDTAPPSPTWELDLLPRGFYFRESSAEFQAYIADKPDMYLEYKRRKAIVNRNSILWDVQGASDNDIYVCGAHGAMMHWDGHRFRSFQVGDDPFVALSIEAPHRVWVSGRDGRVLRGNAARGFEVVIDADHAFTGIAQFKGLTYIVSIARPRGLFTFDGRRLSRVSCGLEPELDDVHSIQAVDDVLWVLGSKDLLRYDGKRWERIEHPLNPPRR